MYITEEEMDAVIDKIKTSKTGMLEQTEDYSKEQFIKLLDEFLDSYTYLMDNYFDTIKRIRKIYSECNRD